jgi:hypothetical protein
MLDNEPSDDSVATPARYEFLSDLSDDDRVWDEDDGADLEYPATSAGQSDESAAMNDMNTRRGAARDSSSPDPLSEELSTTNGLNPIAIRDGTTKRPRFLDIEVALPWLPARKRTGYARIEDDGLYTADEPSWADEDSQVSCRLSLCCPRFTCLTPRHVGSSTVRSARTDCDHEIQVELSSALALSATLPLQFLFLFLPAFRNL